MSVTEPFHFNSELFLQDLEVVSEKNDNTELTHMFIHYVFNKIHNSFNCLMFALWSKKLDLSNAELSKMFKRMMRIVYRNATKPAKKLLKEFFKTIIFKLEHKVDLQLKTPENIKFYNSLIHSFGYTFTNIEQFFPVLENVVKSNPNKFIIYLNITD